MEGQLILCLAMAVRWQDTHLIVLESVLIMAPYDSASCKLDPSEMNSASGKAKLERVKKVLDGERQKIFVAMPELRQGG